MKRLFALALLMILTVLPATALPMPTQNVGRSDEARITLVHGGYWRHHFRDDDRWRGHRYWRHRPYAYRYYPRYYRYRPYDRFAFYGSFPLYGYYSPYGYFSYSW